MKLDLIQFISTNMMSIFVYPYNDLIQFMKKEYNLEQKKRKNQIENSANNLPRDILPLISEYAINQQIILDKVMVNFANFLFFS
jgi:hypothetical protein